MKFHQIKPMLFNIKKMWIIKNKKAFIYLLNSEIRVIQIRNYQKHKKYKGMLKNNKFNQI